MALTAVGNFFVPLAPSGAPLGAAASLIVAQLVGDSAATVYEVTETSVRQALVEDRALGRVGSTFRVAEVLVQLLAMLLGALLAEAAGLRLAASVASFGAVLGAVILWVSPARRLVELPSATTDDGSANASSPGLGPIGGAGPGAG